MVITRFAPSPTAWRKWSRQDDGFGDMMWGSEIKKLDVGLPQGINLWIDETTYGIFDYGFFIDNLDIVATIIAAILVGGLVIFSQYTYTPIFGLPGNPVAAATCALIFVRPALSKFSGGNWIVPQAYCMPAAFEKTKKAGRRGV